jgi:uncharacterized protein with FMN-binding domain
VRKGTKSFVSVLSLGLIAAGYQAGQSAEVSSGFSAAAAPIAGGSAGQAAATPAAKASASAAATSTAPAAGTVTTAAHSPAAAAQKATTAAKATTSTQAAPAAPAPAAASPAAPAAPAAADVTKTGSAINYRYGTVQVSVTKANGKITAVNLLQAGATGGRQGAFSYLVQYAIQANGTSFGNLGGATFTTDAFKQSLESALAKF